MAALVVQSRFAGLKIEDDDHSSTGDSQKSKKSKINTAKKAEPPKKIKPNNKSQTVPKKKKSKQNTPSAEQWEQWKQKDEELVDGNFETELEQAIILSKLDYEAKKDGYKQIKKEAEVKKKVGENNDRAGSKKLRKKNVMSLDQFNDLVNAGDEPKFIHDDNKDNDENPISISKDKEFFERIKDDAKNELLKVRVNDRVRYGQTLPDRIISKVHYADALEKKDIEIASLRQEITTLKQELWTVKSRNKKLCNILGQGEMKDKAEVLVEVERLRAVQAELTAELASLHTDLEKERSKNTDPRAKDKKKKGGNSDKDK
ncbi:G kinase-anchoring protein 1-like isoform X2 [Achroia grisella]|uniref:G kinase-anchoring protein 1-like isoform X2 n=1 Tax=Achroia grisella TaxID=688607 RepID=UPI0027D326AE|nr:G kinase-anchoring protein 1-like isoform X2 [Achroia grisella]